MKIADVSGTRMLIHPLSVTHYRTTDMLQDRGYAWVADIQKVSVLINPHVMSDAVHVQSTHVLLQDCMITQRAFYSSEGS
jgi:hypothetical protein